MDTHFNEQQDTKSTSTPQAESKTQSSVSMDRARASRGGVCYDFEKMELVYDRTVSMFI